MKPFKNLSIKENAAMLKFPVYISLLAANGDSKLDEAEKMAAIRFAHTKTFTCEPVLTEFHREADLVFENNLMQLDIDLPRESESRKAAIKMELFHLEKILLKLGKKHASLVQRSMKSFKEHVTKAHHSVLVDFILPLPIPGLTE